MAITGIQVCSMDYIWRNYARTGTNAALPRFDTTLNEKRISSRPDSLSQPFMVKSPRRTSRHQSGTVPVVVRREEKPCEKYCLDGSILHLNLDDEVAAYDQRRSGRGTISRQEPKQRKLMATASHSARPRKQPDVTSTSSPRAGVIRNNRTAFRKTRDIIDALWDVDDVRTTSVASSLNSNVLPRGITRTKRPEITVHAGYTVQDHRLLGTRGRTTRYKVHQLRFNTDDVSHNLRMSISPRSYSDSSVIPSATSQKAMFSPVRSTIPQSRETAMTHASKNPTDPWTVRKQIAAFDPNGSYPETEAVSFRDKILFRDDECDSVDGSDNIRSFANAEMVAPTLPLTDGLRAPPSSREGGKILPKRLSEEVKVIVVPCHTSGCISCRVGSTG